MSLSLAYDLIRLARRYLPKDVHPDVKEAIDRAIRKMSSHLCIEATKKARK